MVWAVWAVWVAWACNPRCTQTKFQKGQFLLPFFLSLLNNKVIWYVYLNMEKSNKNKWTNKFRELGKKKGSRKDFINLYKEMKKEKDKKKEIYNNKDDENK